MYISEEECKKCGLCCWFDPKNIWGDKSKLIHPDGYCIHHGGKGNGCTIHNERSKVCRDFLRGSDKCLEIRKLHRNK